MHGKVYIKRRRQKKTHLKTKNANKEKKCIYIKKRKRNRKQYIKKTINKVYLPCSFLIIKRKRSIKTRPIKSDRIY